MGTGEFDADLVQAAQRRAGAEEAKAYAAESFELSEAQQIVTTAERFVPAIATVVARVAAVEAAPRVRSAAAVPRRHRGVPNGAD